MDLDLRVGVGVVRDEGRLLDDEDVVVERG